MDETGGHYLKWNKPEKINTVWCYLYVESKIFICTHRNREYNGGFQGLGVGENWEKLVKLYKVIRWIRTSGYYS